MSDKEKKKGKSKEKKTEAVSAEPKVKGKALAKSDEAASEKAKSAKKKEKAKAAKEVAGSVDTAAAGQTNGNYRPTHDQIAQLAHSFYVARGSLHGYHEQDWLRAEQELMVVFNS